MFPPQTRIRTAPTSAGEPRYYIVQRALDAPAGWHELLATHTDGRSFVLRVPPDVDGAERIRGEAVLARKHKNEALIASVELVEHNGWPVQVLEYVDGMTLEALAIAMSSATSFAGGSALAPQAVCRIARQIAMVLVELHERAGVAHGALAADRIIIDGGGNARLLDVGCARPQGPHRMRSPERQRSEGGPSTMDDLWALGVLLCDATLGTALFDGEAISDANGLSARLVSAGVSERLRDALSVLVAPMGARLTNATAAVRIFTELEKSLGDGAVALREALREVRAPRRIDHEPTDERARTDDKQRAPKTQSDITHSSALASANDGAAALAPLFSGFMKDAGVAVSSDPITLENNDTQPSNPRTMELTPDKVVGMRDLVRMSALAEEASKRANQPRREDPISFDPPPIKDIHEMDTASDGKRQPARPTADVQKFSMNPRTEPPRTDAVDVNAAVKASTAASATTNSTNFTHSPGVDDSQLQTPQVSRRPPATVEDTQKVERPSPDDIKNYLASRAAHDDAPLATDELRALPRRGRMAAISVGVVLVLCALGYVMVFQSSCS